MGLGAALRQAWVGYQRRLDEELAAAGFADPGFPDGRVLRMCTDPAEMTISQIGRQLGITRQGAGKIVASLGHRGYVTVVASTTNGREKIVKLTPRANDYLGAQRKAARTIENRFRAELGPESLAGLHRLLWGELSNHARTNTSGRWDTPGASGTSRTDCCQLPPFSETSQGSIRVIPDVLAHRWRSNSLRGHSPFSEDRP